MTEISQNEIGMYGTSKTYIDNLIYFNLRVTRLKNEIILLMLFVLGDPKFFCKISFFAEKTLKKKLEFFISIPLIFSQKLSIAVLSIADLLTVILVLFSGISRGVGKSSFLWTFIDAFLHIPIGKYYTY